MSGLAIDENTFLDNSNIDYPSIFHIYFRINMAIFELHF